MVHELVVLVFIDGRCLLWRGIAVCGNASPDIVAVVAVLLAALLVVRVIVHAKVTHHTVHCLLFLVCRCPDHKSRGGFWAILLLVAMKLRSLLWTGSWSKWVGSGTVAMYMHDKKRSVGSRAV